MVTFISRYFLLFNAIVRGIFFFISISDSSFLVNRNVTLFCILVLYPETLQNLFVLTFLIESLGFSIFNICHLQIVKVLLLLLFFYFLNLFIYLIYLFLAALGLRCCAQAFSSCGERGLLFIAVRGFLITVASLVVEHGLLARRLSSCGAQAQ